MILYNVSEQNTTNFEEGTVKEMKDVEQFIAEGIKIGDIQIGGYDESKKEKPRPLKTFRNKNSVSKCRNSRDRGFKFSTH